MTYADGSARAFTYGSDHRLTNDQLAPLSVTFAYSVTNHTVTQARYDGGNGTLGVQSANIQGLVTNPAADFPVAGVLTDGRNFPTSYLLDRPGRPLQITTPDGATRTWLRDFGGAATVTKDALNHVTSYIYLYGAEGGDIQQITYPDGTIEAFKYDTTFHKPIQVADQRGNLTSFTYRSFAATKREEDSGIPLAMAA